MDSRITHPFGPLFNENSRVLILGSFPSVKSREQQFFYGHPQNRFWKVLAALYHQAVAPIQYDLPAANGAERAVLVGEQEFIFIVPVVFDVAGMINLQRKIAAPMDDRLPVAYILGHVAPLFNIVLLFVRYCDRITALRMI